MDDQRVTFAYLLVVGVEGLLFVEQSADVAT